MKILKRKFCLQRPGPVSVSGLLLFLLMAGCGQNGEHSLVGRPAPDFRLKGLHGENISLEVFRDRVLIIEFQAPWGGYCRKNIQPLKRIQAKYPGIVILGPSLELGKKQVSRFVEQQTLPQMVAFADRTILDLYGVSGIPVTVLVDGNGIVRHWHAGPLSVRVCSNGFSVSYAK